MKKTPKRRPSSQTSDASPQIGVRISPQERMLLGRLIAYAERKMHLAPGTLTPAGYARSALLAQMAQALAELEAEGEPLPPDTSRWDRLRENVALMDEAGRATANPTKPRR
jgi:hypothetical protein